MESTGIGARDLLGLAHAVYRFSTWVSAKESGPTRRATWEVLYEMHQDEDAYRAFRLDHPGFGLAPEDERAADDIIAWATGDPDTTDDYRCMLRNAIEFEEVAGVHFALVCSAVPAFYRETGSCHAGSHVGDVHERTVFERLTLRRVVPAKNSFRARGRRRACTSYRLLFNDAAGNQIVWFSSRSPEELGLRLDEVCSLKATVREHKEYCGIKQTQITRARLLPAEPIAADGLAAETP